MNVGAADGRAEAMPRQGRENEQVPELSLVLSTRNRTVEISTLLESLARQTASDFDLTVVDQNEDDRLAPVLRRPWPFPIRHVRGPHLRGISAGRNAGLEASRGAVLLFPDDDCWYPPELLESGLRQMRTLGAQLLSGRAAMPDGRGINGRYARVLSRIDRRNVWICQMEWVTFVRRELFTAVGPFDENLGTGSDSPNQAGEGVDLILRALDAGLPCYFDPDLSGRHLEIELDDPSAETVTKMRGYARAMGFVMARHGYGAAHILYWMLRPLYNALRFAARGRWRRALCHYNVAAGRGEGYLNGSRGER